MKLRILVLLASGALPALALAVEYKAGWQAEKFYDEVTACRTAVVRPAIQGYVKQSTTAKMPEERIRNDVISMLPLFEQVANMGCFCAVNEIAKAVDYKAYHDKGNLKSRLDRINKQLEGPICGPRMSGVMKSISENRDEAARFRLN